jgi:ferredoxin-NADP reductase
VVELVDETASVRSIVLDLPDWPGHRAGQHVDVRLTAEDGYMAQRSYSIASGPDDDRLVLTVERLEDGEVSPYLTDELRPGDELELRGPIGGYFVWEERHGGPLFLAAGGSGIVPLRAMLRHHAATDSEVPVRLLYSARSLAEIIYRDELTAAAADGEVEVRFTLTREQPDDWQGYARRIDRQLVDEVAWPSAEQPLAYVCGPTGFVELAAGTLVELGHDPARIKTERFGPT